MAAEYDIDYEDKEFGAKFYRDWLLSLPTNRKRLIFDRLERRLKISPPLSITTFKYIENNDRKAIYNRFVGKKENVTYQDFRSAIRSNRFYDEINNGRVYNYLLDFLLLAAIHKDLHSDDEEFRGITEMMVNINKEYIPIQNELNKYITKDVIDYVLYEYGNKKMCKKCKKCHNEK